MGQGSQRKKRARKAKGKRIVSERRARLAKKPGMKSGLQPRVPGEKTILFLFLFILSLIPLAALLFFLTNNLSEEGEQANQADISKTAKAIQKDLAQALPGSFWLKPEEGEEVRLEKIKRGGLLIASLAYLNRAARQASENNSSAFTYLLRNEETVDASRAEDIFQENSQDIWQKGKLFFFVSSREPWREFYLLNKEDGRIALLLNASGKENKALARELFARLSIIEEK